MIQSPILGVLAIGGVFAALLGAWLVSLRLSGLRGPALDVVETLVLVSFGLGPLIVWAFNADQTLSSSWVFALGFASMAAFDLARRRRFLSLRVGMWVLGVGLSLAMLGVLTLNRPFDLNDTATAAVAGLLVILLIFSAGQRLRSLIAGPRTGLPTPSETGTPA